MFVLMKKQMFVILMKSSVPPAVKKYGEKFNIIDNQCEHSAAAAKIKWLCVI